MIPAPSAVPTFLTLPPKARAYVAAVVVAGCGCLVAAMTHLTLQQPVLFAVLLALAIASTRAPSGMSSRRRPSGYPVPSQFSWW